METTSDPIIIQQLAAVVSDARQIFTGAYEPRTAMIWYMKAIYWYRRLYGPESVAYKELVALREGLVKKTAHPAIIKAKANEFIALVKFLDDGAARPTSVTVSRPSAPPNAGRVLVIHGHDELNTLRLKTILTDHFHLDVIVMTAEPGKTRPLIDKFEDSAKHCSFAFALFTADDSVVKEHDKYDQARPNVFFETGWFVGRLGRERVVILLKGNVKIHSDFDGVSRIQFRDDVKE